MRLSQLCRMDFDGTAGLLSTGQVERFVKRFAYIFSFVLAAFPALGHFPRATLDLTACSHQLRAEALHPSGLFTADATNTITTSPTNYDTLTTLGGYPVRSTTVTSQDGTGRPLTITNILANTGILGETLAWTGDQLLATHTLAKTNFTDSRAYFYGDMNRRMVEERLNLDATHRWTNVCAYDSGQVGGPGALTKVAPGGAGVPPAWSGTPDSLSRIATETNSTLRRPAWGNINAESHAQAHQRPPLLLCPPLPARAWPAQNRQNHLPGLLG